MNEHESDILIVDEETEVVDNETKLEQNDTKSFFTYDFTQKNKPTKEEKKATQSFVNYNNNNLNKIYKKYDVVETYVPKKSKEQKKDKQFEKFVNEQHDYTPERETVSVEKVEDKPKLRLKSKAKSWFVAIVLIISMLGGLAIYNAVQIQNLNTQITETTVNINNINGDIKQVVKNIDELTDEDNVLKKAEDLGLKEVTEENKVNVTLNEKNVVEDYESQTNFFDKICNFLRNLFGG